MKAPGPSFKQDKALIVCTPVVIPEKAFEVTAIAFTTALRLQNVSYWKIFNSTLQRTSSMSVLD